MLDWTERWERAKITKADFLGLTESKILRMGRDEWRDYAAHKVTSGSGVVGGVDGEALVYGAVLSNHNDHLLKARKPKERALLRNIRRTLERLVMVAIAIEDTESGGGTYGIHQPRYAVIDEEEIFHELLTEPESRPLSAVTEFAQVKRELQRRAKLKRSFDRVLSGKVPVRTDRALGQRGMMHFNRLMTLIKRLDSNRKRAIASLVYDYDVKYLYTRRDGGPPMPWPIRRF